MFHGKPVNSLALKKSKNDKTPENRKIDPKLRFINGPSIKNANEK